MIRVLVAGACGRMGQETVRAICGESDMEVAGASDVANPGRRLSEMVSGIECSVDVIGELEQAIDEVKPDVMVDFTSPAAVMGNLRTAILRRVPVVVGTTGITQEDLAELKALSEKMETPALVVPNFAIGAILMMRFAAEAAKYMPAVEIIELHHDKKLDAPSGTSIKTAEMIAKSQGAGSREQGTESAARGEEHFGIRVHSVRLPGFVAHQEVILGGQGQTLTIRHDSIDRTSFMPGVLLAIRKVRELDGVVYGLDNIL